MAAGKTVLVTGGAGYIGAHTVWELHQAGFRPVIIDDLSASDTTLINGLTRMMGKPPVFYQGSCNDHAFLERVVSTEKPSSVIHFAAYKSVGESVREPLMYYRNNLVSLVNLLEVMKEFTINRCVFSSSCTVYGQPDQIPVDEATPMKRAESPYGATKQMGERILEDAVQANTDLHAISLRYFNPIGAHPSGQIGELPIGVPNNLVPYLTQVAVGEREKLTVFGNDYDTPDGSCIRDYIHVVDLAKAHVRALEKMDVLPQRFEVFNLGSGTGASVLELIHVFQKATGVKLKFVIGPRRSGDVEKVYANPAKANRLLDWHTELSTEDALRHAWSWQQHLKNLI